MVTAGAYLQRSSCSFQDYLLQYEKHWNVCPRRPVQLQHEYPDHILYTIWELSYTRLKQDDPDAAKLLELFAYFSNQTLWYELFHIGLSDSSPSWLGDMMSDYITFDSVMGTLVDYCFLEVPTEERKWSMHACVHDWTVAGLNKKPDVQQYWYAFDCVAGSININDHGSLAHVSYSHLAAHATWLVQLPFYKYKFILDMTPDRLDKALELYHYFRSNSRFLQQR